MSERRSAGDREGVVGRAAEQEVGGCVRIQKFDQVPENFWYSKIAKLRQQFDFQQKHSKKKK